MIVFLVREDAALKCGHMGPVAISASQHWVKVEGVALLVDNDPVGKRVDCPFKSGGPCIATVSVERGYSAFIRVDGRAVCRDDLVGTASPNAFHFAVTDPGQKFVSEKP
jgi:hypothetical protein